MERGVHDRRRVRSGVPLQAHRRRRLPLALGPRIAVAQLGRVVEQARGECIPMSIPANKPAPLAAGVQYLPSLDADTAERIFGGDFSLLRSVVTSLLREYADLALPICVSPDNRAIRAQGHRRHDGCEPSDAARVRGRTNTGEGSTRPAPREGTAATRVGAHDLGRGSRAVLGDSAGSWGTSYARKLARILSRNLRLITSHPQSCQSTELNAC